MALFLLLILFYPDSMSISGLAACAAGFLAMVLKSNLSQSLSVNHQDSFFPTSLFLKKRCLWQCALVCLQGSLIR